jgi:large subunit ribosomal protein L15
MKLQSLAPKQPKTDRKRRGQGRGTGNGTFGGRGCKGQKARAGGGVRLGFEGGQTPLIQRMPKMKGFKNVNRTEAHPINLSALEARYESGEKVNLDTLLAKKLIVKNDAKVKILGDGELSKKLEIEAGIAVSASAKAAIEKAGGAISS